jgi:hypothetical protein
VLLSAVAGKAARHVFEYSELIVVTTENNVAEVEEYIPYFAARYGLPDVRDTIASDHAATDSESTSQEHRAMDHGQTVGMLAPAYPAVD